MKLRDARETRLEKTTRARQRRARAHLERLRRQREHRRPTLSRWSALALLPAAMLLGAWMGDRSVGAAHVERLSVHGTRHLSADEIARWSEVEPGTSLAAVDLPAVAARLTESSWVDDARVLALPDGRLVVEVDEREAVARVAGPDGTVWAVDAGGTPFGPLPAAGLDSLPRINAAVAPQPGQPLPELVEAAELAAQLQGRGLPAPLEVGVSAPDDPEGLSLRLEGLEGRVVLGRHDLETRLEKLAELLAADLEQTRESPRIDLRFRGQAVLDGVTPSSEETAQEAAARGRATTSNSQPTG